MFRGRGGLILPEWVEEVEASVRGRHLSSVDHVFFMYDHLEGEAREEIKYRSQEEREDPVKIQCGVQGSVLTPRVTSSSELVELKEMLKQQQRQLDQLTQNFVVTETA